MTTGPTAHDDGDDLQRWSVAGFSADGTNWTPCEDNPIIAEYGSDVEILPGTPSMSST